MKDITITNKATIAAEGKLNSKHCQPVVCFSKKYGIIRSFSSVADAAEILDINANYISTCMSEKKLCKGYRICRTRDVPMYIDELAEIANNNATDAHKWQEQEAEKERIRLAEEKRRNDIANLKKKIAKLDADIIKCSDKYRSLVDEYNDATMELEALLDESPEE